MRWAKSPVISINYISSADEERRSLDEPGRNLVRTFWNA